MKSKYIVRNRSGRVVAVYSVLSAARRRIRDTDYHIQYIPEDKFNEKTLQNEA